MLIISILYIFHSLSVCLEIIVDSTSIFHKLLKQQHRLEGLHLIISWRVDTQLVRMASSHILAYLSSFLLVSLSTTKQLCRHGIVQFCCCTQTIVLTPQNKHENRMIFIMMSMCTFTIHFFLMIWYILALTTSWMHWYYYVSQTLNIFC